MNLKKIAAVILVVYIFTLFIFQIDFSATKAAEAVEGKIETLVEKVRIPNTVTSVYLQSRVYDTLFEVLVFSVAVVGVTSMLKSEPKSEISEQTVFGTAEVYSSGIVAISITVFLYVVLNGHLSPGGGFAGGVILASSIVLYGVSSNFIRALSHYENMRVKIIENLALIITLSIMTMSVTFPDFILAINEKQSYGSILSGGVIPLVNLLVGIKVYAGSWKMTSEFVVRRGTL
ncbi:MULTISPECIES: MnhB domain-containing protein [unclassified Kosmotoga]|jgi:multicomponent Na+:H+ antiporter subunit B|uniref:MnhB domain-containing protein n=1 Tax=unclassified Kosmotoga TaxID=2631489 RepID=UPI0007C444CD|nr:MULTISPECIES: MnhB domain-containing protein [unclassified Kosmotoga]MDI3523434.1 multicomponent Na+:H+ antiporter subunit [Kosmotoga sp.]MDK2952932.1 multicomponent Na+:H+ antiporter subunit [Kosmotoga sp.]OAA19367.1 sodium:proton antiporter [Kosmotoga sp. DU53]